MDTAEKVFYTIIASIFLLLFLLMADSGITGNIQCDNWQIAIWDEHNSDVYLEEIDGGDIEKLDMDFNSMPQGLQVGDRVTFCEERSKIFHFRADWTLSEIK